MDTSETIKILTWAFVAPFYWLLGYALALAAVLIVLSKLTNIPGKIIGYIGMVAIFVIMYVWLNQFIL